MSVVTTGMDILNLYATASASNQERPRHNDEIFASTSKAVEEQESEEGTEPKKSKSSRESKRKEKDPKKHHRSETPPENQQSSKRQTGKEPRGSRRLLPFGEGEDKRKQK